MIWAAACSCDCSRSSASACTVVGISVAGLTGRRSFCTNGSSGLGEKSISWKRSHKLAMLGGGQHLRVDREVASELNSPPGFTSRAGEPVKHHRPPVDREQALDMGEHLAYAVVRIFPPCSEQASSTLLNTLSWASKLR